VVSSILMECLSLFDGETKCSLPGDEIRHLWCFLQHEEEHRR
jgi:hypothetical protein